MSAAQLDILPLEPALTPTPAPESLRQQAAATLAAHRQRRTRHAAAATPAVAGPQRARRNPAAASVAQSIQEKYAHSPSYRAVLAEEARRAIEEAAAAAAVAARTSEAVAEAQHQLLAELELWTAPQAFTPETAAAATPIKQISTPAGLTVRLYEDLGRIPQPPAPIPTPTATERETEALNDEIAFRQSPHFDDFKDPHGPIEPIAANLLEFPRQLVAPRKVRPTLAEGPLREESHARNSQLRIFEVQAALIAHEPAPTPSATPAEWATIWLDAHTPTEPLPDLNPTHALLPSLLPPQTAAVHLRLMAFAVDAILILTGLVTFTAVAASAGTRLGVQLPAAAPAAITLAATLAVFYLLYNALFFTLSDQTPGMRYARIGFCTFTDENPSRRAMRRRILATLVATTPLALGLLWVWLDDDRLGWHDRISRMYPRAY